MTTVSADCFDAALAGAPILLMSRDGTVLPAAVARWHAAASGEDRWLLDRCIGPTVDLGCGPGRLVAALAIRGVPALGVDCARRAVRMCQSRGDAVLHRDLFTELPAEGRWHHVLLVDGNIGIAGDPVALLRRCAALVRPGGTLLVETASDADAPATGLWRGLARLHHAANGAPAGPWFRWAVISLAALIALATDVGLRAADQHRGQRCFVELRRGMS